MTRKPCSRCDSAAKVEDLERQLDATLWELAETQALEMQHGAVVERLRDTLDRLVTPAPGVTEKLPPWAHGLAVAALRNLKGPTT
jgi:hypothetical protein